MVLSAKPVEVAVKSPRVQTLEGKTVVFVRKGDKFEAREVELGGRDGLGRGHVRPAAGRRLCGEEQLRHQGRARQGGAAHEH